MILVTLGTQDKPFTRLLKAVEAEVKNGTIKDKVVVQAGFTKYSSKYMEIFDLVSMDEFDKLLDKAEFVITHGGVGSILGALRKNKKVIAVARTAKYREHTNDHQKQIVDSFSKSGYILECLDLDHLSDTISKIDTFKPKKYKAGNKKMLDIIVFDIFNNVFDIDYKISNFIAWLLSVMFAFFTNKTYVFESKESGKKLLAEAISFTAARLFSLAVDMVLMIVLIDFVKLSKMLSKVIVNVVVVILNYVLSKLFIFRKEGVHAK